MIKQVDEIERLLKRSFFVSKNPDLPDLFSGPDLIATQPGVGVAVFVEKASEVRDPRQLLSRLILSRLSLPPETATVLVSGSEQNPLSRSINVHLSFTHVIRNTAFDAMSELDWPARTSSPVPRHIRSWQSDRTAFLLAFSQNPRTRNRLPRAKPAIHGGEHIDQLMSANLLNDSALSAENGVTLHENAYIAEARPGAKTVRDALGHFLASVVMATYRLHGEHVELARPTVGALMWPDPSKHPTYTELRRAAFAGWAVVDAGPAKGVARTLNQWIAQKS